MIFWRGWVLQMKRKIITIVRFILCRSHTQMKKNLFSACFLFSISLFWVFAYTSAQSNLADVEQLLAAGDWGYGTADIVTTKNITNTSITLTSPVVKKDGVAITGYQVTYSDKPLASAPASSILTKVLTFGPLTTPTVDLTIDNLTPWTKYYFAIEPVSIQWLNGIPSDQVTANTTSWSALPLSAAPVTNTLNAAGPASSCEINNISYTVNSSRVTLTRTPTVSTISTDISLRFGDERTSKKLTTINWSAGTYSFTVSKAGTYFATFIPQDSNWNIACREKVQTIKVWSITPIIDDDIPKNGPSLTIALFAMAATVVLYLWYKTKRSA